MFRIHDMLPGDLLVLRSSTVQRRLGDMRMIISVQNDGDAVRVTVWHLYHINIGRPLQVITYRHDVTIDTMWQLIRCDREGEKHGGTDER